MALTFGFCFNKSIAKVTIPSGLQTLTFGFCFNQSIDEVTLPSGLQTLTFGYSFNQSIVNVTLPAGLEAAKDAEEAARRAADTAADARDGLVDPASPAGAHALRSAARVKALALASRGRYDIEGLDRADVETGSSPAWKRFLATLSSHERTLVRIYRCGAIRTPTKRHRQSELAGCPFCSSPCASARHF